MEENSYDHDPTHGTRVGYPVHNQTSPWNENMCLKVKAKGGMSM